MPPTKQEKLIRMDIERVRREIEAQHLILQNLQEDLKVIMVRQQVTPIFWLGLHEGDLPCR
jgi:uncharacterized protein YcgL (UPF0745 family)